MNLDDILELAQARTPSSLERARTRRDAKKVLQDYAKAIAEGRSLVGDLDVDDMLGPRADEAARIIRVAQSTKAGWLRWDAANGELSWSDEMSRMFGYPAVATRVALNQLIDAVHPDDYPEVRAEVETGWRKGIPVEFVFRLVRPGGTMRYLRCLVELLSVDGLTPTGIIATAHDVTRQELDRQEQDRRRRRRKTEAAELPGQEAANRLLSRERFTDHLDRAIVTERGALLVVAVEPVMRTTGLSAEQIDQVTRTTAGMINEVIEDRDMCGSLGSGEFGILLHRAPRAAEAIATTVVDCLRDRLTLTSTSGVKLRAWGGLVPFTPADPVSGADLLLDAAAARADGRRDGSPLVVLPRHREPEDRARATRADIRGVIAADRLCLYAQSILDLSLNEITRHEILLRVRGVAGLPEPPAAFLATAERMDEILAVDRWVIEHSLAFLAQGPQTSHYQINLSGRSVSRPGLLDHVLQALERHQVSPETITFEITESAAVDNLTVAKEFADGVRREGCGLALDDFGTGNSSLLMLKYLPIDLVKLDGDFVAGLRRSAFDRIAVQSVVDMCRALGVRTAAEFVEDSETIGLLRDLGVDFAQGYAIQRPTLMASAVVSAEPGTTPLLDRAIG